MNSNEKKSIKLGMSSGKAIQILRKMILFDLIKKLNLDICYRCGTNITQIEDLSIEHKIAWLNSEYPKELFFDLTNIAFSHLHCNCSSQDKSYCKTEEFRNKISHANAGNNAVLTSEQVNEIREKIKQGRGIRELAREYKISHVHVINIRDFKRRTVE
jgi:hypothetical protein